MGDALNILITNDDGLYAEGLKILRNVLSAKHRVVVVAPDKNRSAISHGITMYDPLRLKEVEEGFYSCSGTPVDCVLNGVRLVLNEKPDVVISGINKGANMGTDLVYSGTAAAARQASLFGIPGIAVSLTSSKDASDEKKWNYVPFAEFIEKNLEKLIKICSPDVFINVNARSSLSYKGAKFTELSRRDYHDSLEKYISPNGKEYSFFVGGDVDTYSESLSDYKAVENGYISISRINAQPVAVGYEDFTNISFAV